MLPRQISHLHMFSFLKIVRLPTLTHRQNPGTETGKSWGVYLRPCMQREVDLIPYRYLQSSSHCPWQPPVLHTAPRASPDMSRNPESPSVRFMQVILCLPYLTAMAFRGCRLSFHSLLPPSQRAPESFGCSLIAL